MPNTRTKINVHLGLTSHVYYPPDCTYAQPDWQLGVSIRIFEMVRLSANVTRFFFNCCYPWVFIQVYR